MMVEYGGVRDDSGLGRPLPGVKVAAAKLCHGRGGLQSLRRRRTVRYFYYFAISFSHSSLGSTSSDRQIVGGHNVQQSSQLYKLPSRLLCTLPSVVKY